MRWIELSVEAPGEYAEPIVNLFARHLEGRVIVESPGGYNPDEGEQPPANAHVVIRGWLPMDATVNSTRAMIDMGLRLVSLIHPLPALRERQVSDDEWSRQSFEPVRVGRRLVIVPPGSNYKRRARDIEVLVEPGLAFGTGHHPTTRMCLVALEGNVKRGDAVLDVGCGSAILSIAALKLGAARAVCLDIEEDAVKASRANLTRAGVVDRASVAVGSLPHEFAPEGGFDIAVANISANVVIKLADELVRSLAPDGLLVASGVLDERSDEVEAAILRAGGRITAKGLSADWVALEVRRGTLGT